MSGGASLDLRYPIGLLFLVLGGILATYGLVTASDTAMYARSAGVNINLVWGGVIVLTGALFLGLAARAARR